MCHDLITELRTRLMGDGLMGFIVSFLVDISKSDTSVWLVLSRFRV